MCFYPRMLLQYRVHMKAGYQVPLTHGMISLFFKKNVWANDIQCGGCQITRQTFGSLTRYMSNEMNCFG